MVLTLRHQVLCILSLSYAFGKAGPTTPSQVHLAYGGKDSLVVSWSTRRQTADSLVELSLQNVSRTASGIAVRQQIAAHVSYWPAQANGTSQIFIDGGVEGYAQVLHRVTIGGLQAGALYVYRCGSSDGGWSEVFTFVAKRSKQQLAQHVTRLLLFGDMGVVNSQIMPDILADVQQNFYDAVLQPGDFAYDMRDQNGRLGDEYMQLLEPMVAHLPLMVSPGNHEWHYNFSHYRKRFTMPHADQYENLYYSFDLGPAHIVSYNTEVFFWPDLFSQQHMRQQYEWLEADLAAANGNRQETPWIIVMGHRPFYCVVAGAAHRCDLEHEASRLGIPSACPLDDAHLCSQADPNSNANFPIEELFQQYSVDVAVFGHIHDYEAFYPTYDRQVFHPAGRNWRHYLDPKAPVHVTSGAAGNSEMVNGPLPPPHGPCNGSAEWCRFQAGYYPRDGQQADYSYSKVYVHNATHLHWVQWSSTLKAAVDEFWIEQNDHGSFDSGRRLQLPGLGLAESGHAID